MYHNAIFVLRGWKHRDYSYRLLAVDDEPDILRTNRRYQEARGYRVDSAVCAQDALELLKKSYDGILLDVLLADMNGFALCETVRTLTFSPILFLLGNPGRVIPAQELYREVWRTGKADAANTVAVHMARLRHKLEDAEPVIGRIETIRGEGYRFLPKEKARTML